MGTNISEADVRNAIAGNQNSAPPFFKGTSKSASIHTGESVGAKRRLKGIPTYGFWGKAGSVNGYRYRALNQLNRIVASIHTDLGYQRGIERFSQSNVFPLVGMCSLSF